MIHFTRNQKALAALTLLAVAVLAVVVGVRHQPTQGVTVTPSAQASSKPALTVEVVSPRSEPWATRITGTGPIAPWQEAIIGSELSGMKLVEVQANVGDVVRKGQVLATLLTTSVQADLDASRASLREAQADLAEARANAERARSLQADGVLTARDADRAITAEKTAVARGEALRARVAVDELRLGQTRIVASDEGVVSVRQATVGSVVQAGQELFRLIRQQRLEWRAEVPLAEVTRVRPGMRVELVPGTGGAAGVAAVVGTVRMVAPTVNAATRNALVYVDLPVREAQEAGVKAGMFATGHVAVGEAHALSLPQSAVLLRDGFSYAFVVQPGGRVRQVKLQVARRQGERVEVVQGLSTESKVVASGVSFLADGDTVQLAKGQ